MQMQRSFSGFKTSTSFGGDLLKDKKNRTARPISSKKHMHLVLKSSHMCEERSLFRSEDAKLFRGILNKYAEKYFVVIVRFKLVGNHVHILFKVKPAKLYKDFIRSLTGQFAQKMIERFKLNIKKFFDERPFTRVIEFGRDYIRVISYIQNQLKSSRSPKPSPSANATTIPNEGTPSGSSPPTKPPKSISSHSNFINNLIFIITRKAKTKLATEQVRSQYCKSSVPHYLH